MADLPPYPDSSADTREGPGPATITGTPLWVKVFGIIALIAVVLFIILTLIGGDHSPARHAPPSGGGTPLSSISGVTEGGQTRTGDVGDYAYLFNFTEHSLQGPQQP